ncbi:glycosyltransferase family 2 protein [Mastigocladopsis repens]|uniref:glycosyltransferase family 2 protein n=1 Tax=Mastigocladopsis repens TaxID=221287 RepID=UPI000313260F|nr:glycosyltransferase family 2 protein [Mastigocladopsis repens]
MPLITRTLTLDDLPSPPPDKIGWPWTVQSSQFSEQIPDGFEYPRISIVTPNYNYGHFLEETIRSVLLQGYPNLEYIIIDGGSTDNSVEIIKKYEKWLSFWVSEKDSGQANAINKGIDLATGTWFNWLNSDDILLPTCLKTLVEISQIVKEAQWITGARIDIDKSGKMVDICVPWRTDPTVIGLDMIDFPQDATFVKISFLKQNKIKLSEEFNNVFDTVLHWQLIQLCKPILTSAVFSAMRWHDGQKTLNQTNLSKEYVKGVLPLVNKLPLTNRIVARLLRTRLHSLVKILLSSMVSYGLTPASSEWKAVVFNRHNCTLEQAPARLVML